MKTVTEFPYKVKEYPDMAITMPDGCRLSARVWIPEGASEIPVPTIVEHLPYRKRDGTIARDEIVHPWFAGNGYACVRVDMRGNGESEGLMEDEYTAQELDDACHVIEWASKQSWCNGNIGMMGISWGGFNGLQVAALQPPALKAIITVCSSIDRYEDDIHFKGGCLLGENFGWSVNMLSYSSRPPDPALVGDNKWKDMWLTRLENMPFLASNWLKHQNRDEFWKHGSICEDYSKIKAAVLSIGGWHDGYRNTISHLVENLNSPVKGIVGPWIHKYPHNARPEPAIGFLQEAKRWWDHWLKNENTGVEDDPAYRAWLMDSIKPKRWVDERPGRWIAEEQWPSETIEPLKLWLGSDSKLNPGPSSTDAIVNSPQDCGVEAGEYFPFAFGDELPGDQMIDDHNSTCFDGEPLLKSLDVVGAPTIRLKLSSDKSTGQVIVRLCDLRPDGTSGLITFGMINLTQYLSHETPQALESGKEIEIQITLDQIAYRIPKGHQLRVAISTAYFPYLWPSPETTTLHLFGGKIELPIRQTATEDEWQFEEPESSPAWQVENLRPTGYSRNSFKDENSGETITTINCDFGENRDLHHGLISGSWMKERWSIHPDDPNSARSEIQWEQSGGRDGAMWKTLSTAIMYSDSKNFYHTAKLECWENNNLIFKRDFEDKIERKLV